MPQAPTKRWSSILLLLSLVVLASATGAHAVINPGCQLINNFFQCDLLSGENDYQAVFDINKVYLVEHIRITNNTGSTYQLDWVRGNSTDSNWGEFSVYLDLFATRQDVAGIGEVASRDWDPLVKVLVGVSWDPAFVGQGLVVQPNQTVILHNNADAMIQAGLQTSTINYTVDFRPLSQGVSSFRQPKVDAPRTCNGANQWTTFNPWLNNTGQSWHINGATIYAVVPEGDHTVDWACVRILNTSGQIRWSHCSGVNQRGMVSFAPQTVLPGESINGRARHQCSFPGVWDWAAFIHVF